MLVDELIPAFKGRAKPRIQLEPLSQDADQIEGSGSKQQSRSTCSLLLSGH